MKENSHSVDQVGSDSARVYQRKKIGTYSMFIDRNPIEIWDIQLQITCMLHSKWAFCFTRIAYRKQIYYKCRYTYS